MQNELRAPRDGTVDRVAVGRRRDRRGRRPPPGDPVSRQPPVPAPDPGRDAWRDDPRAKALKSAARARGRVRDELGHRDRRPVHAGRHGRPRRGRATSAGPGSSRSPAASSRRCTASRFWTMRQYAGFATAAETNERFRYLLEQGQTGLSVAFDLPTQMGYDSDAPQAAGEVGRVGVPISSLADMETLFADIPLGTVSTSMTINATARDPARPVRGGRRAPGRAAERGERHDPERHPQGVHRPGHVHLPDRAVDAPRDRHLRVRLPRAAQVEHDQHLRLSHARGRRDGRPGARLHPRRRHRLLRRGRRPRPRHRRLRRPAVASSSPPGASSSRRSPSSGRPAGCGRRSSRSASGHRTSVRWSAGCTSRPPARA